IPVADSNKSALSFQNKTRLTRLLAASRVAPEMEFRAMTRLKLGILLSSVVTLMGCDSNPRMTDIPRADWSRERLADAGTDKTFAAAKYALQQWFTIDIANPAEGLLTTAPSEYDEKGGTGRIRDTAIKYPNRMRRRATVRVLPAGSEVSVECVVIK